MQKTQTGWIIIGVVISLNVLVLFGYKNPTSSIPLAIISAILLLLFYNLTISVENGYVKFWMGIGLIRGQYSLHEIESCRAIQYFPLGWGIRWRPGVILFNVSGTKAIELSIKGKSRKIWIGTDYPDEIADYINMLLHKRI